MKLFCYKYNKILIYQPQCYMIYDEVNNQMFKTDFQYNYWYCPNAKLTSKYRSNKCSEFNSWSWCSYRCIFNPSIFCMILTQPRTTFKQADFFTKWLSYLSLIAKKKSQAQLHGEGSQNRPRPFSYDAHWWILENLNFRLHMECLVSK